jgi:ATP-dependent helicase HrpA
VQVFASAGEQEAAMRAGTRRLLRLTLPSPVKTLERQLSARSRLVLASNPDGSLAALLDDCADAAVDALIPNPTWTRGEFEAVYAELAPVLPDAAAQIVERVEDVLRVAHEVRLALPAEPPPALAGAIEDIRGQFRSLLPPGFVRTAGRDRLPDLTRYLRAIARRLELLPRDVDTDRARMQRVHQVRQAYDELRHALPGARAAAPDVADIGWQIEELRVSLWAQQLGTRRPVSEKRIFVAIDAVQA